MKRLNRQIRKVHWRAHREGTISSISTSAVAATCLGMFAMVMSVLAGNFGSLTASARFGQPYPLVGYRSTSLTAAVMMDSEGWAVVTLASLATAMGSFGFSVASLVRLVMRMLDRRRTQGRLKKSTRLQKALTAIARTSKLKSDGVADLGAAVLEDLKQSKRKVMLNDLVSQALIKDFDRVIEDVGLITADSKPVDDTKSNAQTVQNALHVQSGGGADPKRALKAIRSLQSTALRIARRV